MGKRILITGVTTLANKGTAAIIIQTIEAILNFLPNSKILVELSYPEKQRKIMEIENENVEIVPLPIQNPIKGILLILLAAIYSVLYKLNINLDVKTKTLRRYQEADIIVDISAEAFINYYGEGIFSRIFRYLLHLPPILISIFLNKPFVLYAQTLAPFGSFRPLMKYIINKANLVTVRDSISIYNLKKEGINISNIYVTADPAFLLNPSSNSRVEEILLKEKIHLAKEKGEKPIIGLVAARNIGRVMGISEYETLMKIFSDTADTLIKNLNVIVIFIPHHSGKIRKISDDVFVGIDILKSIKNKENFKLIRGDYLPQELKGIISKCDVLVSLRMHPVIAATSMYIPSVIIAFNEKAYGLMQKLGQEKYICNIMEISCEELFQKVDMALADKENISLELKSTIPEIRRLALLNAELLGKLICNIQGR